jgi:hypothetical protein
MGQLMNEKKFYKALGMFDERLDSTRANQSHKIIQYQKG